MKVSTPLVFQKFSFIKIKIKKVHMPQIEESKKLKRILRCSPKRLLAILLGVKSGMFYSK